MTRLLILALLVPTFSLGQKINSTESGGQNNIYNNAIKYYLAHIVKRDKIKLDTLLIEENEIFTDSLQTIISGTVLKVIDGTEIKTKLEREKSFTLYKLFPLRFDNGQFYISIVPYSATKNNDEVNLAYGGGCNVIYSFNSPTKQFKFVKVHCWAI